jgi:glycosyltransferase involved in cell wall biosynthesis
VKLLLITHEFPPFNGGIGRYTQQLGRAASALEHDVTILAPDYGRDSGSQDGSEPFETRRFRGGAYSGRNLLAHLHRTYGLASQGRFDLIHAMDWPTISCLHFINRFRSIPFVATAYGTEVLRLRVSKQSRLLRAQNAFLAADRVFAISEFTKSLLLRHSPGIDESRIEVTLLGVDEFWFHSSGTEEEPRDTYGLAPDGLILLTAGRLEPHKGHRLVIEALQGLEENLKPRMTWIVAGTGHDRAYEQDLRQRASRCGVRVVFTGRVSDEELRRLYRLADLFCVPGEPRSDGVEGFGLVYLEAAAQGTPTLATSFASRPEVIRHGETGILVPPGSVEEYRRALEDILADFGRRQQLGNNARDWAKTFTWDRCARLTYGTGEIGTPLQQGTESQSRGLLHATSSSIRATLPVSG